IYGTPNIAEAKRRQIKASAKARFFILLYFLFFADFNYDLTFFDTAMNLLAKILGKPIKKSVAIFSTCICADLLLHRV
ncbi:MAG TPA: hypothetical protein VE593_12100, partial [Nitrososphaeraceae archaeon]|nr:hypothetical protein [Nitrososphaeraceae archaeon]